jgi:CRISPR-associated Cas5-like protein
METMFAVRVHASGLFNSFKPRSPEDVRYHRTFDLPPRTTLLGFAAAALGLGERELYVEWGGKAPLAETLQVTSILEEIAGHVRDHWTITKIVERSVKGKKKRPFPAMQVREQLFKPSYVLYFASTDEKLVENICGGIRNPSYPLCLGRDDELVRVSAVQPCTLRRLKPPFTLSNNTLLPIEFLPMVKQEDRVSLLQSLIRLKFARRFSVKEDGTRVEEDMKEYVQLTIPVQVEADVEAYTDAPTGEEGSNLVFL